MTKPKQTYKRPTLTGWAAPLFVGPFLSMVAAVSLFAWLGPEWKYVSRWVVFGVGLAAGSIVSFVYTLLLGLIDVLLLAVRVRTLPTGKNAWLASFGSTLAFLGSYLLIKPWAMYKAGPWVVVGALVVPMLVSAIAARVLYGARVLKSDDKK